MSNKKVEHQLAMYDFRWSSKDLSYTDVVNQLRGVAKKFTFQLEEGDSGYKHYQGRLSLIKKRRWSQKHIILALFTTPPNYLQPTTNPEFFKGDAFYASKKDTRIEGPWTDKDEIKNETTQLKLFKTWNLRPYQKRIYDECFKFDMRKINLIWDTAGNSGKSLFSEWLEFEGLAEEIPAFRLMDDIFQWVASRPIKRVYLVDMPRGMKKDRLGDFYSGIEVIKNGVAYDKRYNAKKVRFNRPRVFVFTNTLPNLDLMSKDRWVIWKIEQDFTVTVIQTITVE